MQLPSCLLARVMVASRCEGDTTWTFEQVRTPNVGEEDFDQTIVFGRPGLVLNQSERIAHLLFVEADDYRNGYSFGNATDSTLYWYRKGYSSCP